MTAKRDSTKVMWRVQVKAERADRWLNMGLYETRARARENAAEYRANGWLTRSIRYEKKGRK